MLLLTKILTRRRTLMVFIAMFLVLECCVFVLMHQWWLPEHEASYASRRTANNAHPNKEHMLQHGVTTIIRKPPNQFNRRKHLIFREREVKRNNPIIDDSPMFIGQSAHKSPATLLGTNAKWAMSNTAATTSLKQTKHNNPRPQTKKKEQWDPGARGLHRRQPVPLKVGTPIFVASLPKSGTTSIWQYFKCGGHKASHQWIKTSEGNSVQVGSCIRNNIWANNPPLQGCGDHDVYTDTGLSLFVAQGVSDCYYPSISALSEIQQHYPNATILHVIRNSTTWLDSMQAWGKGSLLQRWTNCNLTAGLTPTEVDPHAFLAFYEWHAAHIRDFCRQHPSLTYIEVALESPHAGQVLAEKVGIPASCWGKCNPASKYCDRVG